MQGSSGEVHTASFAPGSVRPNLAGIVSFVLVLLCLVEYRITNQKPFVRSSLHGSSDRLSLLHFYSSTNYERRESLKSREFTYTQIINPFAK